ncbi:MAG: hypothetical protein NZM29_05510, partial [Nitrospira sp.]|nr:hypothetical protein [Nitrospira sp.]
KNSVTKNRGSARDRKTTGRSGRDSAGGEHQHTPRPFRNSRRESNRPSRQRGESPARHFHGSVELDPLRVGAEAGRIAQEIIAHLAVLSGTQVRVTIEIDASASEAFPDHVVRTVTENSRTPKFSHHAFERE